VAFHDSIGILDGSTHSCPLHKQLPHTQFNYLYLSVIIKKLMFLVSSDSEVNDHIIKMRHYKVLHLGRLQPYWQILHRPEKAYLGQTL